MRLSRVGFDNTLGYLNGGIEAWIKDNKETDTIASVSPEEFEKNYENTAVIDCRRPAEYTSIRINKAKNIPLDFLNDHLTEIPKEENFYIHCAGGYRSVIWSSIMKSRGYHNMINVEKGMSGIKNTAIPLIENVCPSTLK
jgi:hydroxyacylglutathione hydrolase